MICSIRSTVAAATLSLLLATSAFAAPADEPGYIDLGRFTPSAQGQFVEVNILVFHFD